MAQAEPKTIERQVDVEVKADVEAKQRKRSADKKKKREEKMAQSLANRTITIEHHQMVLPYKVQKLFGQIKRQRLSTSEYMLLINLISQMAVGECPSDRPNKQAAETQREEKEKVVNYRPMNEGAIPLAVNEILEFLETEIIPPPADQLIYVDTNELLQDALAIIQENRIMGVDVEGCRLSRTGEACILTIGVAQGVYLFDIVALKELNVNFSHALSFLEDRLVLKIMFDVRGDSDALFHQLNISLVSVLDLQLLDIAAKRTADRRRQPAQYRNSLKTVFTERLEAEELGVYAALTAGLETAHRDFVSNPGLWRDRPLRPQLIRYASIGVRWLPILAKRTFLALDDKWQKKVAWTTEQALSEWRDAPVEVDRRNRGNAKAPKFNAQATSIMELDPTLSEQYLN